LLLLLLFYDYSIYNELLLYVVNENSGVESDEWEQHMKITQLLHSKMFTLPLPSLI